MAKKVLITGGAGFIGANFVHRFLDLGYQVAVIERKEANYWRLKKVMPKIKVYSPDITHYASVEKCLRQIKPHIVLHFVTYGAYQRFQQDRNMTVDTNIKGTINLMHACQKAGVKCFINTSSSSEYGIKDSPMKESDAIEPDNLYGITKVTTTFYAQMMAKKFGFPVVTTRLFSVYGPFEEKERLIPVIIMSCLKNFGMALSKPDSVRDFIFIEDVMDAYLVMIDNIQKIKGQVLNLGTGKQSTVGDVVAVIKKITGSTLSPAYEKVTVAQTEPKSWVANTAKMKKILGWKPSHTLEAGLTKNVAWFKEHSHLYE